MTASSRSTNCRRQEVTTQIAASRKGLSLITGVFAAIHKANR